MSKKDPISYDEVGFFLLGDNGAMAAPCDWDIDPTPCDASWDTYSPETQAWAITMASAVLWASTGRQFGECPVTVRPCGKWDNNAWWGGYVWGFYASGWGWGPFLYDGFFAGCGCGLGGYGWCECIPANQVWLPGPVSAITSVMVDGATIDPSTYRVDDAQWLVRTSPNDGSGVVNTWPWHQNYNFDSGDHTFEVTYTKGKPIPPAVLSAGGLLASQYAKACVGAACQLPSRVVSVVRQNISMHAVDVETLMDKGLTGVALVDQIIASYNPYAIKSPYLIISPDQPEYRQTTWTSS